MHLQGQSSIAMERLTARLQQLSSALLEGFELESETLTLEGIDDLYEHYDRDQLFLVQDGVLHWHHEGHNLVSFHEGSLVGLLHAFDFPSPQMRADEFVQLTPINRDKFLLHIYSNKRLQHYWSHYLLCQNALLLDYLSQSFKENIRPTAGFQNLNAGDVIIQQGDQADIVYTIISGEAEAMVDGVKVGDISEGEVFGAMAVFTGQPRSASVVARTACTVMAVPKDDFVLLIQAQPQAALNLIETLANKITELNQQLLGAADIGHA